MTESQSRSALVIAGLALLAVTGWIYRDTFAWIRQGWVENPYFSHGPLVPLLVVWLIWRARGAVAGADWQVFWPGLGAVAAAGLMFICGRVLDLNFVVGLSLVVLLHAVLLTCAGPAVHRLLLFPLGFLVFAVPLSQLVIHHYSFPLQLASAKLGTGLMNLLTGAGAVADGTLMRMDGEDYLVAVECSGFKALLGLTMVGVLVAYLTATSRAKKALIALLAAPIAVVSNIVRLFLILIVGRLWGHRFAIEVFHDLSGGIMLLVSLAILIATARAVVGPGAELAAAPAPVGLGLPRVRLGWAPLAACAAMILLAGGLGLALVPPPPPAPEVDLAAVPLEIGPWRGVERAIDERVAAELGEVAIIQRTYTRRATEPPMELIVICGRGRRSLHPPAACYVGAGHDVLGDETRQVTTPQGRLLFQRLIVGDGSRPALLALYTFTDGERTTPDYAQHQRESVTGERVTWTQLHFATAWRGSVEATEQALLPFIEQAWPVIRDTLPKPERAPRGATE